MSHISGRYTRFDRIFSFLERSSRESVMIKYDLIASFYIVVALLKKEMFRQNSTINGNGVSMVMVSVPCRSGTSVYKI
jgi:hypothetical protein